MEHTKAFNIAIDGPAGAGKSTIARLTAGKLGFVYVDTGAMYRAIALYMLRNGVPATDKEAVASAVRDVTITIRYEEGSQRVLLNGEDVSGFGVCFGSTDTSYIISPSFSFHVGIASNDGLIVSYVSVSSAVMR